MRAIGLPLALAGVTFAVALGLIASLNYARYGVFITNEFKAPPFLRAYGALARIEQDHWRQYVVFPKDARERAYSVSPAARELVPVLDGPRANDWAQTGCVLAEAAACPEVPSDVFMWELREAVSTAGHYKSAPEAMRFYGRLASEINAACAEGRIRCGPPRATLLPVFHRQYLGEALRDAVPIAWLMLTLGDHTIGSGPSEGSPAGLTVFADTVGGIYPAHSYETILSGWAASPFGTPRLYLRVSTQAQVDTTVSHMPAPDVAKALPGWDAWRFDLITSCPRSECALVVSTTDGDNVAIPLYGLKNGYAADTPRLRVFLDYAAVHNVHAGSAQRRRIQVGVARIIAWTYAFSFPALAAAALIGVIFTLIRSRGRTITSPLVVFAAASATAAATRLTLLAYLDATSIPAQSVLYTSPASPFVIIFSIIGCWCLAQSFCRSRYYPLCESSGTLRSRDGRTA